MQQRSKDSKMPPSSANQNHQQLFIDHTNLQLHHQQPFMYDFMPRQLPDNRQNSRVKRAVTATLPYEHEIVKSPKKSPSQSVPSKQVNKNRNALPSLPNSSTNNRKVKSSKSSSGIKAGRRSSSSRVASGVGYLSQSSSSSSLFLLIKLY